MDVIRNTVAAVVFSINAVRMKKDGTFLAFGSAAYWLAMSAVLGFLIVAGLSKTFIGLITTHESSSEAMASSTFLNTAASNDFLEWSVQKGISKLSTHLLKQLLVGNSL